MFSLDMSGLNLRKVKKSKTVLNTFIEIVNESNRKENKFWDNQGGEF